MKLSPLFAAAILAGVAFAPNAQASDVNFNGPNYNMGTVATGQTGTIATNPKTVTGGAEYALASGTLSPDTEIVFTYTGIPGTTAPKVLTAIGTYIDSGLTYYTTSQDNGSGAITVAYSIDPGLPPGVTVLSGSLPVLVTANIGSGKTVIENLSSLDVSFSSYLKATRGLSGITATYNVSSVPLPPAFLLFASGLIALAGFAAYKKAGSQV
jgi:hypothetical protein